MKQILMMALGALLLLQACGDRQPERGTPADTLAVEEEEVVAVDTVAQGVHVEDLEYSRLPSGQRILTGRLVNPTDRHVRNAQIQVALYDETNRGIGSMLIVVQDVAPETEKDFRETVEQEDAAGARVRAIMTQ